MDDLSFSPSYSPSPIFKKNNKNVLPGSTPTSMTSTPYSMEDYSLSSETSINSPSYSPIDCYSKDKTQKSLFYTPSDSDN